MKTEKNTQILGKVIRILATICLILTLANLGIKKYTGKPLFRIRNENIETVLCHVKFENQAIDVVFENQQIIYKIDGKEVTEIVDSNGNQFFFDVNSRYTFYENGKIIEPFQRIETDKGFASVYALPNGVEKIDKLDQ